MISGEERNDLRIEGQATTEEYASEGLGGPGVWLKITRVICLVLIDSAGRMKGPGIIYISAL